MIDNRVNTDFRDRGNTNRDRIAGNTLNEGEK